MFMLSLLTGRVLPAEVKLLVSLQEFFFCASLAVIVLAIMKLVKSDSQVPSLPHKPVTRVQWIVKESIIMHALV